jgi:lysophospholipase L1-like esterase
MPLGDSITGSTCYRALLWQRLVQSGRNQIDFIGTRSGGSACGVSSFDRDNEGHGGYIVTDVLKATSTGRPSGADATDPYVSAAADLMTWLDGHPADVVLMQFGTNDVWNGIAPETIRNAYSAILARLRSNNPNVVMLVAQITPLNPSGCGQCVSRVQALNALIPAWATDNTMASSPVRVVDQFTGFDVAADTSDSVHPNESGSRKMADKWYDALLPFY